MHQQSHIIEVGAKTVQTLAHERVMELVQLGGEARPEVSTDLQ